MKNENEVKSEDQIKIEKEAEWFWELINLGTYLATLWSPEEKKRRFDNFVKQTQEIDKNAAIGRYLNEMEQRYFK